MNILRRLRLWAHLLLAGRAAHDAHIAYLYRQREEALMLLDSAITSGSRAAYARQFTKADDAWNSFADKRTYRR